MKYADFHSAFPRGFWLLISSWVLGLCTGTMFFFSDRDTFCALLRDFSFGYASAVGVLASIFLPFVLSIIACACGAFQWLSGIAFCRAFSFSFTFAGFLISFPTAGWLIRLLLCFDGVCSVPILLLFWMCALRAGGSLSASVLFLFAAFFLLIGSTYYCLVMPFAAGL